MVIKRQYIGVDYYKRPPLPMNLTSVTIHSTANPKSTAQNERDNLNNNHRVVNGAKQKVSFHAVVDQLQAIECIPITEGAYHCSSNSGNRTSYSIEICESGDREKTLRNAIEYTAKILIENKLQIGRAHV